MKNNLFINVITKGLLGVLIGILGGFAAGLLIWGLLMLLQSISGTNMFMKDALFPLQFFSMGLGAIMGAMIGTQIAFKENK